MRVRGSRNDNSGTQNGNYPLMASEVKYLRHPAKPLYRKKLDSNAMTVSNVDSEDKECHRNTIPYKSMQDIIL